VTLLRCAWCGRGFAGAAGPGRPRLYCKHACRQRDYEARRRATELGLSESELVVAREELESLRDRLFLLRCAVEDVDRAQAEDPDDVERLVRQLLDIARETTAATNGHEATSDVA
jgi:hypothetical protein